TVERTNGWVALFDGSNTQAWREFYGTAFPADGWKLEQGTLIHGEGDGRGGHAGGDLTSRDVYQDFEFAADCCLQPGGNSGIKYPVVERHRRPTPRAARGLEYPCVAYQAHSDAKQNNRRTGGIYDVAPPGAKKLRAAGRWTHRRSVVN